MAELQIEKLEDLIIPILGPNKKYLGQKIAKLTSAGDNYGSLMLGVTIYLEDQGQTESVNVVAKLLPRNEVVQIMFNCQRTFRNEIGFYQTLAPSLRKFQEEQGLSELFASFPAFYGARTSLDPSCSKVDDDAVLLIKNIKDEGFINIDRTVGFNLEQSRLILAKLAELHATFLAFKTLKPDLFEKKMGRLFEKYTVFDSEDASSGQKMVDTIVDSIRDDQFCAENVEKIKRTLTNSSMNTGRKNFGVHQSQFSSFVHSDMWVNNIMVKMIDDEIADVKFVDFQLIEWSSLTKDVVFFLFTSVEFPVIRQNCDDLLQFYYDNFIIYLKQLKCDTSVFSFDGFIDDMKTVVQESEFFHIMLMLAPIYASDKDTVEVENMNVDKFLDQRKEVAEFDKQKGSFIVQEFIKRAWI